MISALALPTRQLHPLFAAEIDGVDLSRPPDRALVEAIWEAINRHAVVVFRGQHLDDVQLRDFAQCFGPLEIGRHAREAKRRRLALPEIGDISNLDDDNRLRGRDDRRRLDALGNRLWHTDASYMPVAVELGMLHAVAVPPPSPWGAGETEFADMRAAYDELPEAIRREIADFVVEHDIFWSRGQIGFSEFGPGERERYPASHQRLVRTHPASGRRMVFLSAHASHIVGMPVPEGRLLLHDLTEHATRRDFVYSHKWRVGDLVIWDNRCTMHRGRPHDDAHPRDLRRATTLEAKSTLEQVA